MFETEFDRPTQDARRQAVANVLAWAPGLVRYASRFTSSIDDAEDAYQRAMEIALTDAPSVERKVFVSWLHTVVRNEARHITAQRARERPSSDEELDAQLADAASDPARGPDAVAEWRERYRAVQDALGGLTETQRICLILRTAGVPRGEIESLTGFTVRTIDRAINEGRARLREFEVRLQRGEECARIAGLIDLAAEGAAAEPDQRRLSRHIRHCPACRAAFRTRRDQMRLIATLVPGALVSGDLMHSRPVDPAFALSWWERAAGSFTVRSGQLMQLWFDLPALASSKLAVGALAAAVVGAVGTPIVVDAVHAPTQPRLSASATSTPAQPPPVALAASAAGTPAPAQTASAPTRSVARAAASSSAARRPAAQRTSRTAASRRSTRTAAPSAPVRPRLSTPASEFGP